MSQRATPEPDRGAGSATPLTFFGASRRFLFLAVYLNLYRIIVDSAGVILVVLLTGPSNISKSGFLQTATMVSGLRSRKGLVVSAMSAVIPPTHQARTR